MASRVCLLEKNDFILVTGIADSSYLVKFLKDRNLSFTHLKYKDHYNYSISSIDKIKRISEGKNILTTEKDFGKLKLKDILEPVIALAENGIQVSYDLHKAIESTPRLFNDPESQRIYFSDGKPIEEFSILKLPDLANTFKIPISTS